MRDQVFRTAIIPFRTSGNNFFTLSNICRDRFSLKRFKKPLQKGQKRVFFGVTFAREVEMIKLLIINVVAKYRVVCPLSICPEWTGFSRNKRRRASAVKGRGLWTKLHTRIPNGAFSMEVVKNSSFLFNFADGKRGYAPFLFDRKFFMRELVEQIIQEQIGGTQLFLADLQVKPNRIEVHLDGDLGVNINECATVSRYLHRQLEEKGIDTSNISVEVSSPGIDKPLALLREYKKNVGRKLQIKNNQGKLIKGSLVYVDAEKIILQTGKKNEEFAFGVIKDARVVI
jgi:ribosome maturation factor RimP